MTQRKLRLILTIISILFLLFFTILELRKSSEIEEVSIEATTTPGFNFPVEFGAVEFIDEEWTLYLPVVGKNTKTNCLSRSSEKAGLAWAYKYRGFNHNAVCFPDDFPWHAWNWKTEDGRRNVLWGSRWYEQWAAGTPTTYSGLVFFANEPDRPDQANMTPTEVAELAIAAVNHAPRICLVGPMYSAADSGVLSREFYYEYIRLGGNPDNLCYGSLHIYQRPGGAQYNNAKTRIDEYYSTYLIPTGQGHKKTFVTEIGHSSGFSDTTIFNRMSEWLCVLERDPRIVEYYVFTTYTLGLSFAPMFNWNTSELEPLGEATRLVAGGWVCN